MAVLCPVCGLASQDENRCQYCQAELARAVPLSPPSDCPLPEGGRITLSSEQRTALETPSGEALLTHQGRNWRAHWMSPRAWPVWQVSVRERLQWQCPALPSCHLIEENGAAWVLAESSGQRLQPWSDTLVGDVLTDLSQLANFCDRLAALLDSLHSSGLLWLNFNPTELEEWHEGECWYFRCTNLDLTVYPTGRSPGHLHVSTAYAAPEVWAFEAPRLQPAVDVFHLALFAYYWLAGLLPGGFGGQGLQAFNFAIPPLRIYQPQLPPGIASVLARGYAHAPSQRHQTPGALATALRQAVAEAQVRHRATLPVSWEVGCHSRAGRAKGSLNRANEDHAFLRHFQEPARTLAVLCDGISTCDVGNGALASRLTCIVLDTALADSSSADFPDQVRQACRHACESLVSWAEEQGHAYLLHSGRTLMGTTLTAGWLQDNQLTIANLGDSRAYLLSPSTIEQLTVDSDIRCTLLALRVPPDEVNNVGHMGRALRDCIGGAVKSEGDKLVVPKEHGIPTIFQLTLLPGDIVVLCSDGLVDEGLYLEPEEVAELLRQHCDLPAQVLAEKLADAADARQRLPSVWEPDGYGDNISVVVVKVGRQAAT